MIYYFTEQQWDNFWNSPIIERIPDDENFNAIFEYNFKLKYTDNDVVDSPGFWGSLEGDEKDINWFLLQI